MKVREIKWTGESDDFTANISDYMLRVEQMDLHSWWWCVSFKGEEIASSGMSEDSFAFTEAEAKLMAELAYLRHFVENNLTEKV